MQLKKDYKNVVCVYKITCKPNGKILIGSTTNLYSRINHYRNDVNKDNPLKHYNKSFYDDKTVETIIKSVIGNSLFKITLNKDIRIHRIDVVNDKE